MLSSTPIVCVLGWRRLTAIDRSVSVRTDDILLLRTVPMLAPLPVPVLEQLARVVVRKQLAPDATVFEAGDVGDSFYVIARGSVEVLDREVVVRRMGSGEGFGEIALLGDTTRTMTIRAYDDVELCAISGADFVPAVASISGARSAADATRTAYLRHAPGAAAEDVDGN